MSEEDDLYDVDDEWARMAKKARESWARENPYEDKTGNESESFTITS